MTLITKKSLISHALKGSHTKRSYEINEMKESLVRQVEAGRSSAHKVSSELHESIQSDLKDISKHVAACRSAASELIQNYKVIRQASAKTIKSELEADRNSLTAVVKKIILELEKARASARTSNKLLSVSRKLKLKQTVVDKFQETAISGKLIPEVKSSSLPVKEGGQAILPSRAKVNVKTGVSSSVPAQSKAGVSPSVPAQSKAGVSPSVPAQTKVDVPTSVTSPAKAGGPAPAHYQNKIDGRPKK